MTQEPIQPSDPQAPNLSAMFKKSAMQLLNETNASEPVAEKKEIKEEEIKPKNKEAPEIKTKEKEEVKKEIKEEVIDWKTEFEKAERNRKETRKWGDDIARQNAAYKKLVEKFKEDGNITEEEATELLNHTKYKEFETKEKTFIEKAGEVWDREIENIRKYSDYDDLDKHLHAFQHFVQHGDPQEVEDAYNDIKDFVDSNPILFTKKMLEIGKRHYEDGFSELVEAGNLRNLRKKYEDQVNTAERKAAKLEKEIEKLKAKYEGYDDNPHYRMPQGGDNMGQIDSEGIELIKNPGKLIEKFNQGKRPFPR